MDRLVFIDDDADELRIVQDLVSGTYEYLGLHWPEQVPDRATIGEPEPVIFLSDLYVPPPTHRDVAADFPDEVLAGQAELARKTAEAFLQLYPGPRDAKKRMRQTMAALRQGRDLLDEQWLGLDSHPNTVWEYLTLYAASIQACRSSSTRERLLRTMLRTR